MREDEGTLRRSFSTFVMVMTQANMEAPERTPLEDLAPFAEANWGSFRLTA